MFSTLGDIMSRVFPRPFTPGGFIPPYRGTSAGGQSVNRGDSVLLLLSCNYTMQFVGYNSIKTR